MAVSMVDEMVFGRVSNSVAYLAEKWVVYLVVFLVSESVVEKVCALVALMDFLLVGQME